MNTLNSKQVASLTGLSIRTLEKHRCAPNSNSIPHFYDTRGFAQYTDEAVAEWCAKNIPILDYVR